MFVASGKRGFVAYDVVSIANKGTSERILKGPFSGLGHDTQVKTTNATCIAIPTTQPIAPTPNTEAMREANQKLFMTRSGVPWKVSDTVDMNRWVGTALLGRQRVDARGGH